MGEGESEGTTPRSWLAVAPLVNQRSFVGLMKAIETTKMTSSQSIGVVVDAAKYIVRVEAAERCESEVGALHKHFDSALASTWSSLKRTGVDMDAFLKLYQEPLKLILDVKLARSICEIKDDFAPHADGIVLMCRSSMTGKKLFQAYLVHVGEARLEAILKKRVDELGDKELTSEWISVSRKAILSEGEQLGCEDLLCRYPFQICLG